MSETKESSVSGVLAELAVKDSQEPVGKGVTWRQRRAMGLTRFGIYRAVKQLKESNDWNPNSSKRDMAADVAMVLMGHPDFAQAWESELPTLDWASILAFIEQLLPLILKLIELFTLI